MALIDLGKIKITNKGLWSNVTNYEVDDFVQSGKHTFICIANNLNEEPYNVSTSTLNSSFWSFMAQGAEAGDWNAAENTPEYITNKPKILPCMEVISLGEYFPGLRYHVHHFMLMRDKSLRCFGQNNLSYNLGDGDSSGTREFPSQTAIPDKIKSYDIFYGGGLVITEKDECWAWGLQNYGQLGFGHTTVIPWPRRVPLPSGMTKFISAQVSSGTSYTSGMTAIYLCENSQGERFVYTCGDGRYGAIGDGTTTQRLTLTQVSALNGLNVEKVYAMSSAQEWCAAITSNKDLWTWGSDRRGLQGKGTDGANQLTPIKAQDNSLPNVGVTKVLTNADNSVGSVVVLLENNQLWLTGQNDYGIDGSGVAQQRNSWVQVQGEGSSDVVDFVFNGGNGHASLMILKTDEKVRTIGYNGYGQLGIGNTTSSLTWQTPPATRSYAGTILDCNVNVKKITCSMTGDEYSNYMFIRDDGEWDSHGHGKAFAWGANHYGQLGIGHASNGSPGTNQTEWTTYFPNECAGLPSRVIDIKNCGTSTSRSTVALLSDGIIYSAGVSEAIGRETGNHIYTFGRVIL